MLMLLLLSILELLQETVVVHGQRPAEGLDVQGQHRALEVLVPLVDAGWPRQLSVPCARHLGDDPRHRPVTSSYETRLDISSHTGFS